nr:lipopolysaccharide kinase InaA family protein [uncultured Desulfuromonas sp.]
MNEQLIYLNPQWEETLRNSNLADFERLWELDLQAVDEGNTGRGKNGWSKVSIFSFKDAQQQEHTVVIKRQSNYRSHTLRHPVVGVPTFLKEMASIHRYEQAHVPALKAVYCATRKHQGDLQAILVTEFLTGYQSLEKILETRQTKPSFTRQKNMAIAEICGTLVRTLHQQGLEHRCLFPKHIFIQCDTEPFEARLIDLEKTRWRPWFKALRVRDLTALARRSKSATNRDRIIFMRAYFNSDHLTPEAKQLWRDVARRINKKRRS